MNHRKILFWSITVALAGFLFGFDTTIPSLVPVLFIKIGAATGFAIFAFMMVLQLVWVWRMMPETKQLSLEDLEKQLAFNK